MQVIELEQKINSKYQIETFNDFIRQKIKEKKGKKFSSLKTQQNYLGEKKKFLSLLKAKYFR